MSRSSSSLNLAQMVTRLPSAVFGLAMIRVYRYTAKEHLSAFSYLRQYQVASGASTQLAANAQQAQIENLGGVPFGYSLPDPASEFIILAQCAPGETSPVSVFAYPG